MFNPQNIKNLYLAMGETPPAHLDLPSKRGLELVKSRPHWSEKETKEKVDIICPECLGEKYISGEFCEYCLGQGGWEEEH